MPSDDPESWTDGLPEVSAERAEHIGRFLIMWGKLEDNLDRFFPTIFKTDETLSHCISANLGTKAKTDILKSAVTMLRVPLSARLVRASHSRLNQVDALSAKYRNWLAHGRPFTFEKDGDRFWQWARLTARKELVMVHMGGDHEFWVAAYDEVDGLSHDLFRICRLLRTRLDPLDAEHYQYFCAVRSRFE